MVSAYKAASAAKEIVEKQRFKRWQNEVSGKLGAIHRNTEAILTDLKALRLDFTRTIDSAFRQAYEREVEAIRKNLQTIIAGLPEGGKLSAQNKARLIAQADTLKTATFTLSQYGPPGLPFVISGYAMAVSVLGISGATTAEINEFKKQMTEGYFSQAANPAQEGSFGAAAVVSRKLLRDHEKFHSDRLGRKTYGYGIHSCRNGDLSSNECRLNYFVAEVSGAVTEPDSIKVSPLSLVELGQKPNTEWPSLIANPDPPWTIDRRANKNPPSDSREAKVLLRLTSGRVMSNSREATIEVQRLADLEIILATINDIVRDNWRT